MIYVSFLGVHMILAPCLVGIFQTSSSGSAFKPSAGLKSCFQMHEETSLQVLPENCKFLLRYLLLEIQTFSISSASQGSAFTMIYDSLYYDCLQIPRIPYSHGECQSVSF